MPPNVLLIYANPAITATPIPPYGMERIAQSFQLAGCKVHQLAPFIEANPLEFVMSALETDWDLIGISIRNIDDALIVRSKGGSADIDLKYYIDDIKPIVNAALLRVGKERVLLGGPGFSAAPSPLLDELNAKWGIAGPGDDLCWLIGREMVKSGKVSWPNDPRIICSEDRIGQHPHQSPNRPRGFGEDTQLLPAPAARMGPYLGLTMARGGRAAVALDAGCNRRCQFCVEARFNGYRVTARSPQDVLTEIEQLVSIGVKRFWLATSELNVPDEKQAIAVLKGLAGKGLDLMAFLQPTPISPTLLNAMEDAGMNPGHLSFEFGHLHPELLKKGAGPANKRQIDDLINLWLKRGYPGLGGSILLGAHPDENWSTIEWTLEEALRIDSVFKDGFGLAYATGGRVYPETDLADWIANHPKQAEPHLYGERDPRFLRPVIFCRPTSPRNLLAHVQSKLKHAKGQMGPMNSEAPANEDVLAVEALVNRGIWRRQEGNEADAEACFQEALRMNSKHLEALAQLATLQSSEAERRDEALHTLNRLMAALAIDDPRQEEVKRAKAALLA